MGFRAQGDGHLSVADTTNASRAFTNVSRASAKPWPSWLPGGGTTEEAPPPLPHFCPDDKYKKRCHHIRGPEMSVVGAMDLASGGVLMPWQSCYDYYDNVVMVRSLQQLPSGHYWQCAPSSHGGCTHFGGQEVVC